jgi:hypothetical protein
METHDPHQRVNTYTGRLRMLVEGNRQDETLGELCKSAYHGDQDPSEINTSHYRTLMMDELAYVDRQLNRVRDALAGVGRLDDTLVIVCADHGEALGEGGHVYHTTGLVEPLIRVPLVVSGPENGAHSVTNRVSLTQIYDTIRDYVAGKGSESLLSRTPEPEFVGCEETGRIQEKLDDPAAALDRYLQKGVAVYESQTPTRKYIKYGETCTTYEIKKRGLAESNRGECSCDAVEQFENKLASRGGNKADISAGVRADLEDLGYL